MNAASAGYAADAARVQAELAALAAVTGTQLNDAQKQLTALDTQVGQLINLNKTAVGIEQAVGALGAALRTGGQTDITGGMRFATAAGMSVAATFGETAVEAPAVFDPVRYSSSANVGSEVLVAEIRGLREDNQAMRVELEGLRADQRAQTGATIQATFESNANAARTVVDGVDKSSRASAWANAVKGEYA